MSINREKVCVVGLGYIGLPTAALIASSGYEVTGVDIDSEVVATINSGRIHIEEPGLQNVVGKAVAKENLRAATDVPKADIFIIAVPTPIVSQEGNKDPEPDISYVQNVFINLAPVLKIGDLVLLESTSPVGTTQKMFELLARERPDLNLVGTTSPDISIAYCPERVIPGNVLHELVNNDRIVGGKTTNCSGKAAQFYETFVQGDCLRATSPETAELVKLAENSFRDLNIAFANQLSLLCDNLDIDVWEAIGFANRHPRVNILQPGPGVGGHCIAVDPWFLVASDKTVTNLTRTARLTNNGKPDWVFKKVSDLAEEFENTDIICCGLTFKPDVDDFRESPALQIYDRLRTAFPSRVKVYDPFIEKLEDEAEVQTLKDIARSKDILVLLVDHKELKELRPVSDKIIDTRGCWTHQKENV